jgi:nicotinate dehydrogenase subunit A
VLTLEGAAQCRAGSWQPVLDALKTAFLAEQAAQCGYCTSGLLASCAALLHNNPSPNDTEVRTALDRHLCRCGAQPRVLRAVQRAAQVLQKGAA